MMPSSTKPHNESITLRFGISHNMKRAIIGYHQDEEGHWVADLACGHTQHLRHVPPFIERPWVTTAAGRQKKLGVELNCVDCDGAGVAAGEHKL